MIHYINLITGKRHNIAQLNCFAELLLLILTRIVLEFVYVNIICPQYGYMGFHLKWELQSYLCSWIVFFLLMPMFFMHRKDTPFSNTVSALLFAFSVTPGTIMLGYCPTPFWPYWLMYWGVFLLFNHLFPHIVLPKVNRQLSKKSITLLAIGFVIIALFIWARYSRFQINFNILDVYGIRAEARQYGIPTLVEYLFSASKAVFPLITVWCLAQKEHGKACVYFAAQMITFFIDGSKSAFFSLFLAIAAYYALHHKLWRLKWLAPAFLTLGVGGYVEYLCLHSNWIVAIVIRRVQFVPQLLNYFYWDFFNVNEFDFFRQGILRRFGFQSPYSISIPYIIGDKYFAAPQMSANNGLFSDAYANFGIAGILIMPLLVVLLLRLLDACAKGLSPAILISSILTTTLSLISSSFFTIILTHGVWAVCLILYFLPRGLRNDERTVVQFT